MASDKKLIKYFGKIADQIIAKESEMKKLADTDFVVKTNEFKEMLNNGKEVEDILVDAYALAREAIRRVQGMEAYKVQLIGGIILNSGDISEMRTGEGKTLTGIFPAYLNALTGKGVHIVTVNEYLSGRDRELNAPVFELLGLTTGLNGSRVSKRAKRDAYAADITYTTNSELGFDYLKDNMVIEPSLKVQRKLNFAIIDEADSILIDEARTPLIISGGSTSRINLYKAANDFAKDLDQQVDIDIDLESKQVYLNESGMQKAKKFFSLDNLFAVENTEVFHLIMNALKANFAFKEGIEYTVRDNEIVLIDQFTGRIMEGRSYSDGLQQALQAKEDVKVEEETSTLASITYQNFYRLYSKLSGMTGTAKTEEEEFIKIYNTRVIVTPTNKPIIRKDEADLTFGTKNAALKKLIADIKIAHEIGNPILIGTTSVELSEQISHYLDKAKLHYEMINAKNHDREAEIVAKAGQLKAITLATNMAGRGTDIKLANEVKTLGGLHVYGVERNEARRIDNQLRGRSGRQGDPGLSRFYISMEDDLMYRFSSPKMRQRFLSLGEDHIESKMFTRAVTNAQKKLEGLNFDQRKNVLDYDNILAQQRETIYAQRDNILMAEDLKVVIKRFQVTFAYELIEKHSTMVHGEKTVDTKKLLKVLDGELVPFKHFTEKDFFNKEKMALANEIADAMMEFYQIRIADIPLDVALPMERKIILQSFDRYWTRHLDLSSKMKTGIYLQQYAQNNPLAEYVEQATKLFNQMKVNIAQEAVVQLANVVLKNIEAKPKQIEITDSDIDKILNETGLSKENINAKDINARFDELEAKHVDDKEKIKLLKFQRDVMLGLVIELDKRFGDQRQKINAEQESLVGIAKKYNIPNPGELTLEQVEKKFEEIFATVTDKEEIERLKRAKTMLVSLVEQITKLKNQIKVDPNDDDDPQKTEKVRIG